VIYSIQWWKKIRSILAIEFYLTFINGTFVDINENDDIIKLCIAIELLHSYSLIHDDLPCIDNDEYRRWNLTTWKKYWEANAILIWDLLNSLAFEILSNIKNNSSISFYISQAVWLKWMMWGQILDLFYKKNPKKLTLKNLIETHNKKTWALIEASIIWWLLIAENKVDFIKDEKTNYLKRFLDFWQKIGLAFQIKDDLLDVEWTFEETGKSVGSGEDKGFVYFLWIEKTRKYLDDLIIECKKIIKELKSEKLDFLVDYIWYRKK
jgi:geranylgeranyl diphosphate synthase type II